MNTALLVTILIWVTILLIGNFWMIRHIYVLNRTLISVYKQRDSQIDAINKRIENLEKIKDI